MSSRTLLWSIVFIETLILLCHFLQYFPHFVFIWVVSLMPWHLLLLLPALLVCLCYRRLTPGLFLLVQTAYILAVHITVFLPKSIEAGDGQLLKVFSHNVWLENDDMEAVTSIIDREAPEIIFLQEVTKDRYERLAQSLTGDEQANRWHSVYESTQYLAVFSRFPLSKQQSFGSDRTKIQSVNTSLSGTTVALYNVHFVRGSVQRRYSDVVLFMEQELSLSKTPVILAGDLNATPETPVYELVDSKLANSHDLTGPGFGFTFPASLQLFDQKLPFLPMVRIDHVFHSRDFETISARTVPDPGSSDHFPVSAVLRIH